MRLHTGRTADGSPLVRVIGDLDISVSAALREHLHAVLDTAGAGVPPAMSLMLDLDAVEFIDSTILGVLVGVHKRLMEHSQRLTLIGVRGRILRTFKLTCLDQVFTVVPAPPA
ncbi:STAS domain-containing protein [Dactylosporangium sp. CA-052675]|uniref:STAS domain-containing protein n=1 Tax=Dactylosporangium sp. CA-052675 TaxID=3239927 RepID=UPI003D931027